MILGVELFLLTQSKYLQGNTKAINDTEWLIFLDSIYPTYDVMLHHILMKLRRGIETVLRPLVPSWLQPSTRSKRKRKKPAMAWVFPQQLAIGRLPNAADLPLLQSQGIQTIVSLCRPDEGCLPPQALALFEVVSCPLPDQRDSEVLTVERLRQAVALVDYHLRQQRRVYVHCLRGIERAPTVCVAYLCQGSRDVETWEALQFLREVYPAARPTSTQMRIVEAYLRSLGGLRSERLKREDSSFMAWILPQQLAIGRLPNAADLPLLQSQGIQTIVSLCRPDEGCLPPQALALFEVVFCPLPDQRDSEVLTVECLQQAVALVDYHLRQQRRVYVHCLRGIERSPTVCVAYLCREHGDVEVWQALKETLRFLREVYPAARPTFAQIQIVEAYLRSLGGIRNYGENRDDPSA